MKGYHRNRSKPQNLREIVQSQSGFLGGLNTDNPKSDVGETQVTLLENLIPFRDRIEARGGLKPTTKWKTANTHDESMFFSDVVNSHYDEDWDEILYHDGIIKITGDKPITLCHTFQNLYNTSVSFIRANDKMFIASEVLFDGGGNLPVTGGNAIIEDRGSDFFMRPLTSRGVPSTRTPSRSIKTLLPSAAIQYAWIFSYVRIVDDIVVSESLYFDPELIPTTDALEGQAAQYEVDIATAVSNLPTQYFTPAGTDNFYTHIRYYRTEQLLDPVATLTTGNLLKYPYYRVADYDLNTLTTFPTPTDGSNLNVTDGAMVSDLSLHPPLWQAGYKEMPHGNIADISNAMLLIKREDSEINYCPISSGDSQKYFGYYNAFFQYSAGVNNDITLIKDVGSGCLITTRDRSYYIDTVNKDEDPDQQILAIYTPILSDVTMLNKNIGVGFNQRSSVIESSEGKLIGLTSDGAIREFSGFTWGADLAKDKVHSITKGLIKEYDFSCSANFSNDAYYLTYIISDDSIDASIFSKYSTLRLGTTEESGLGFSVFTGKPDGEEPVDPGEAQTWIESSKGWPFYATDVADTAGWNFFITIKDTLYVMRRGGSATSDWRILLEYTGDKFDRKINKDVVDNFSNATSEYIDTDYFDIPCEVELPEITGSSEAFFLYFLKANFFLRRDRFSYKVQDETTKGYEITSLIGVGVGKIAETSLDDIEFGMDLSIGEDDAIVASNNGFEPTSAVILQREVQDHRIRISLRANSSGFQLTSMEARFKRHDRTELKPSKTTDNTAELSSGMYCLVNQKLKNLAVGNSRASAFDIGIPIDGAFIGHSNNPQVTGFEASLTTGPDGNQTGIWIPGNTEYEYQTPPQEATTTATVMFWYRLFFGRIVVGWNSDEINQYEFLNISDKWNIKNNNVTTAFTTDASQMGAGEWAHIAFVYDGAAWNTYKNGIYDDTSAPLALDNYINNMSVKIDGLVELSDLRMYNKNLTAEQLLLYCKNVLDNNGDYVNGY